MWILRYAVKVISAFGCVLVLVWRRDCWYKSRLPCGIHSSFIDVWLYCCKLCFILVLLLPPLALFQIRFCHMEWLSEWWYISHNKQMQLWHVTFATDSSFLSSCQQEKCSNSL
jgi:hypothetical protein